MNIFEKNIALLEKKYAKVAKKIKEICIEDIINNVGIIETAHRQQVIYTMHNEKMWFLNSRLDAEYAAKIYAERYDIRLYGVYFIFGFSDGRCIREIMKKCDSTNFLVICEPDLEEFAVACHYFDLQDILENDTVMIYFYEENSINEFLRECASYPRMQLLEFCILPGYDVLYHDQCETFMNDVVDYMRYTEVNKATNKNFNRIIPQHRLYHMKKMLDYSNIYQIKQKLTMDNISEFPVIIVSAGPSLDKNIHLLKQAQGKAFIIAVDASVRTTIQAGVRPDLLCSVDPNSPERFMSGLDLKDIFWACNDMSNPILLEKYAKHIFYYGTFGRIWEQKCKDELGYFFPRISSGGSVSTEAFALAVYLGFRKIVLIGQDLAFTGGISHTKGIENALGDNDEYIQKRQRVMVEGVDGTMLQTDFQMWFYKKWFEKAIRTNKDKLRVIDATEGGARIEGAEIMTLEEVITKECTQNINMYELEKSILPMFSEQQKNILEDELRQIRVETVEFERFVTDVIEKQRQILDELQNKQNTSMQIREKLQRVTEDDNKIETLPVRDYLSVYAQNEEYEIGDSIYTEENLSPKQLVEKSLALLKGYQNAAKLFLEDVDEFIING